MAQLGRPLGPNIQGVPKDAEHLRRTGRFIDPQPHEAPTASTS